MGCFERCSSHLSTSSYNKTAADLGGTYSDRGIPDKKLKCPLLSNMTPTAELRGYSIVHIMCRQYDKRKKLQALNRGRSALNLHSF